MCSAASSLSWPTALAACAVHFMRRLSCVTIWGRGRVDECGASPVACVCAWHGRAQTNLFNFSLHFHLGLKLDTPRSHCGGATPPLGDIRFCGAGGSLRAESAVTE